MKNSQKLNPSKFDILNWMNSIIPKHFKRITSIEQMGTGAAYLYAINILKPGSVRIERILNQPQNKYEISSNLKYLASIFEKLQLSYSFQIEKVAQMKYQDNYHLACFLYKMQNNVSRSNSYITQNLAKTSESTKKVKIVLPRTPINVPLKKIQTNPVTKETILALRPQPQFMLQKICEEMPVVEQAKQQKLTKIAKILNLQKKQEKVYSEKKKQQVLQVIHKSQPPKLSSKSESYRRFFRPSIFEKSKYIKQFVDENLPFQNFNSEVRWENGKDYNDYGLQKQSQGLQQLLSQKKQQNKQQTAAEDSRKENDGNMESQEQQLMFGL